MNALRFSGPLRGMAAKKAAKRAKSKAPARAVAKKPGRGGRRGPRGPRSGSKTAFILSQPMDAPAKDVVEAGAKAGHDFDVKYVYAIRSASRTKGSTRAAKPSTRVAKAASATASAGQPKVDRGIEAQFARMVVDIGVVRAEEIVRRVRDKLDRMTF